jgi:polysaccharide biosynthesis/export protein
MSPVLSVRAFRLSLIATLAALALSGCMQRRAPVAMVQPRSDLDTLAYGQPAYEPPAVIVSRSGLASSRRGYAVPVRYAAPVSTYDAQYRLDAGDRLRVVVYGQEGLTNSYAIDAGGSITMPLIGAVPARGLTPSALAASISGRLRNGFIREPSVAVEIEAYRPFFILGEVAAPGQYPYVPNMTVESAVAIAGGFSPRAKRDEVTLTHPAPDGVFRSVVPLGTLISPGDTVLISERWF